MTGLLPLAKNQSTVIRDRGSERLVDQRTDIKTEACRLPDGPSDILRLASMLAATQILSTILPLAKKQSTVTRNRGSEGLVDRSLPSICARYCLLIDQSPASLRDVRKIKDCSRSWRPPVAPGTCLPLLTTRIPRTPWLSNSAAR